MPAPVTRSSGAPTVSPVDNPDKLGKDGNKTITTASKVAACGACLVESRAVRCAVMTAVVACVGFALLCYSNSGNVDATTLNAFSKAAVEAMCPTDG